MVTKLKPTRVSTYVPPKYISFCNLLINESVVFAAFLNINPSLETWPFHTNLSQFCCSQEVTFLLRRIDDNTNHRSSNLVLGGSQGYQDNSTDGPRTSQDNYNVSIDNHINGINYNNSN